MAEFMRNTDAFSWQMEHEPGLRSTVVTIFKLDRAPDWDVLVSRFEQMGASLPMFRQRVVENPAPAPPRSLTKAIREPSGEIAGIASRATFEVSCRGSEPSARIVQISPAAPEPTTKATTPVAETEGSLPDPGPPGRSVRPEPSGATDQTSSWAEK